jgi:hypothetical protein
MQKTQVCMFCRYRRTLSPSHGPASCCAGEAAPAEKADTDLHPARAMPDRLRSPAPQRPAHR